KIEKLWMNTCRTLKNTEKSVEDLTKEKFKLEADLNTACKLAEVVAHCRRTSLVYAMRKLLRIACRLPLEIEDECEFLLAYFACPIGEQNLMRCTSWGLSDLCAKSE
ncbi:hypothetical protein KI387_040199, partial [Taxus chinensis]